MMPIFMSLLMCRHCLPSLMVSAVFLSVMLPLYPLRWPEYFSSGVYVNVLSG